MQVTLYVHKAEYNILPNSGVLQQKKYLTATVKDCPVPTFMTRGKYPGDVPLTRTYLGD